MLSIEGFKHNVSNIEHQTLMYYTYKMDAFSKSVENSKKTLIENFIKQSKLIEQQNNEILKLKDFILGNEYDLTPEFRRSFPNGF